jgi:UDP-N-acetylglucosamine--N-acetylmuramyl-(pentapeptide) pyrophosphoryl-undecaprenol N-acetylglucosamine transferase
VLPEEGLDGKKLFAAAAGILNDPQRMETMSQNMAALGIPDATKRIYDTVMTLLK